MLADLQEMPTAAQGGWLGVGQFGSHESGGITPPMGLAGNWNDGKCLEKELEFGEL